MHRPSANGWYRKVPFPNIRLTRSNNDMVNEQYMHLPASFSSLWSLCLKCRRQTTLVSFGCQRSRRIAINHLFLISLPTYLLTSHCLLHIRGERMGDKMRESYRELEQERARLLSENAMLEEEVKELQQYIDSHLGRSILYIARSLHRLFH